MKAFLLDSRSPGMGFLLKNALNLDHKFIRGKQISVVKL